MWFTAPWSGGAVRSLGIAAVLLVLAAAGLPEVWAYTAAAVRTSSAGAFQVVSGQPSGGMQPFVYCSAPNVSLGHNSSIDVPITCHNGFAHSVGLSVAYSPSTKLVPPSYSPASPLALTVPGPSSPHIVTTQPPRGA